MAVCKCFDCQKDLAGLTFDEKIDSCKCACNSRFQAEENGMKFVVIGLPVGNESLLKLDKIKVDGCLSIDNNEKKCDYLFIYERNRYLFVELKGGDIMRAGRQIENSIALFRRNKKLENKEIRAFVVSSRFPSNCAAFRKWKERMMKNYRLYKIRIFQKNKVLRYNPLLDDIC